MQNIYSIYWLSWIIISLCIYLLYVCISFWSCVAQTHWCLWNYISPLLIFISFHWYPWIHQVFICELNRCHPLKRNQYTTCTASVVINISASWTSFFGDVSVAQLVASMSGVVLGVVAMVMVSWADRCCKYIASSEIQTHNHGNSA